MMTADTAAVLLILAAAPAATLVPIFHAWAARRTWWRRVLGWALMMSSTGLALLIDISLLYQWLGDDYALRDAVRLTVYAMIAAGANLTLVALVYVWLQGRHSD
jgi:hypothetical protein